MKLALQIQLPLSGIGLFQRQSWYVAPYSYPHKR